MQAVRVWSSVWRNAVTKISLRNYGGGHTRTPKMNDMPVPKGPWEELNATRQKIHNLVLAIGVSSLSFGLFLYNTTDVVKWHFKAPKTYE